MPPSEDATPATRVTERLRLHGFESAAMSRGPVRLPRARKQYVSGFSMWAGKGVTIRKIEGRRCGE